MNVKYTDNVDEISSEMLTGFFRGWPDPPGLDRFYATLKGSFKVWLAIDGDKCIGFVNAISDGVFSAFIPLLEVLPEYRGNGIGSKLVQMMETSLAKHYSLDIICDGSVVPFYERLGFRKLVGMSKRNSRNCSGNVTR